MEIPSLISNEAQLTAQAYFSEGLSLFQAGKLEEAEIRFANALALNPNNIDALNLAGICAYQKHEYENALHFLNQANAIGPKSPYTFNTIGLTYQALQKFEKALEQFDIALSLNDDIAEIHNNRGNALKNLLQLQSAVESYQIAIRLNPNYVEAFNNLGVTLKEAGKADDALTCFEEAIRINPSSAEAFNNAGTVFQEIGNIELALQCYGQALQINPNYLEALLNYGNTFKTNQKFDLALQAYKKVIEINPNHALAQYLIAEVFYEKGDASAAQEHYQLAIDTQSDYPDARMGLAIASIPKVFSSVLDVKKSRAQFETRLSDLESWISASTLTSTALQNYIGIGAHQPFYLAYQELDNKHLLSRFGKIGCDVLKKWQQDQTLLCKLISNKGPVRLGIVSAHLSSHPVWHAITKGLLINLDPSLFEVHLFDLGKVDDLETRVAKQHCESYTQGKLNLQQWSKVIVDKNIEALFYPEIGMDPLTRELASLKLAPIQLASWGHPETTGLTTIDYFISAQDLEPDTTNQHYSETLIRLPNLGCYIEHSKTTPSNISLEELGISSDQPILLCPGSPSKYSPENDSVLVEIAKKLGQCQFVFFDFQADLTNILKERLDACFQNSKLRFDDYAKFIPFQSRENFYALMQQSDLYLDTIGFSGFNTAMQAIECNLPMVTREGKFMRGRLASGILKRMGMDSLVAKSNEEYIELAVDLIRNQEKLQQIQSQLMQAKNILFNDLEPIRAFEQFLLTQCRPK